MPVLIAVLINALRILFFSRLGLFIMSALVWLGINFTTVKLVLDPTIDLLRGFTENIGGGTGYWVQTASAWAGVMNFDRAITMVISAVVTKHAIMQGRLFLFKRGV